jgi:hypothetical protein
MPSLKELQLDSAVNMMTALWPWCLLEQNTSLQILDWEMIVGERGFLALAESSEHERLAESNASGQ